MNIMGVHMYNCRFHSVIKTPEELRKSKIIYLSRWRGYPENGILLSSFVDKWIDTLNDDELTEYENILQMNEIDLYRCLVSPPDKPLPREYDCGVFRKIRDQIHRENPFKEKSGAEASTKVDEQSKHQVESQH